MNNRFNDNDVLVRADKRRRSLLRLSKYLVITLVLIVCCLALLNLGSRLVVGIHQRGVMFELREWKEQYSSIHSVEDAVYAITMVDYIRKYYAVGDGKGYYSFRRIMLNLENQRAQTLDAIVHSLEQFTGLDYGHDYEKWKQWMEDIERTNYSQSRFVVFSTSRSIASK